MKTPVFWAAIAPPFFSAILLTLPLALFSGCYTLKQGTTMLGYLGKAVPLEELAANGGEKSEEAAFAERVAGIRRFAMEELGLKESKNYTRYVELDRDYLAAIVSACAADSFTRHEWRFPVVGAVPYKGFFDPEDARKEAMKLKAKGFDVWVRPVDAFSTLGWFRDPLYSYMKNYSEYRLANLIIHELLHATVFVKGQVEFNEQLAEFIGNEGSRLYIERRFGKDSAEYAAIDGGDSGNYRAFREYLAALSAELETVYANKALDRESKLAQKETVIRAALERFKAEYDSRFQSDNYRNFTEIPVNNAYLDLYRLYHEEDNFFADLFAGVRGDDLPKLKLFIAAAASLNKSRAARSNPREALQNALP